MFAPLATLPLLCSIRSWLAHRRLLPWLWLAAIISVAISVSLFTVSQTHLPPSVVWGLLMLNVVLLLAIAGVYARRIKNMWSTLSDGFTRSRLQRRIIIVFGLVTTLPTIVVSVLAFFLFHLGIQSWFNEQVQTALSESLAVAEAYFDEHKENLRGDILAMSADLNRAAVLAYSDPTEFKRLVATQTKLRLLSEVVVFQPGRVLAQGRFSFALAFENLPPDVLERAGAGQVVFLPDESGDKVRALVGLSSIDQGYLLIGRLIDGKVLGHMAETQGAYAKYEDLRANIQRIQLAVSLIFIALALLLLGGSVWYGLMFATRLTAPILKLATAAERVRSGDYSTRVTVKDKIDKDEITLLARAFNRMTEQLGTQRDQLVSTNRHLDQRRRFSEAVLAGVSAGVIALDADKNISLANRSAEQLLGGSEDTTLIDRPILGVIPAISDLLADTDTTDSHTVQGNIIHARADEKLTLNLRIAADMKDETLLGYIVTFDDITALVSAQRHAAWSDVARRVAHEIKNPLTPIALAAERLKRKYADQVGADERDNFNKYTDTIAHHVQNIGAMVEEFVQFARMPTPTLKPENISTIIKKVIFSEQVAHPEVSYVMHLPDEPLMIHADERQISQLLINLYKNSAEAMEGMELRRSITTKARLTGNQVSIEVTDTGPGFPEDKLDQLFAPYMTTRAAGTGLGLSIAKKIMDDHKGSIQLQNLDEGGACITLSFLQHCGNNIPDALSPTEIGTA